MAGSGVTRFAKQSSIYAIGNISRQLIGFIMLPIYTQHMTPADYGVLGLLTFAISLIDILFGARLVQVVPKFYHEFKEAHERKAVISTALIQTSVASAITLAIILASSSPASKILFGSTGYELIFSIFAVTILTQAIENYGLLYLRIQHKAWTFLSINLCKLVLQLILNIWLVVYMEMGALGAAITSAGTSLLFALLLGGMTIRHTGFGYAKPIAQRMLKMSWPLWFAAFAGLYIGSANRYYMRLFGSLEDIGLFELAMRFASILGILIWRPINLHWQTERFSYYKKNQPAPAVYQTVFWFMTLLLTVAALGINIFADTVIKLMANDTYHDAAALVPYLTTGAIFTSLITYVNFSFLVTEKTGWITKNNYFMALVATIFFLWLIPNYGLIGSALAVTLIALVQFLITNHSAKREYDMRINVIPLFMMLAVSITGYVLANLIFAQQNPWLDLAIKLGVFLITSAIMLGIFYTNRECRAYLQTFAAKLLKRRQYAPDKSGPT